jgi:hypothetical protein
MTTTNDPAERILMKLRDIHDDLEELAAEHERQTRKAVVQAATHYATAATEATARSLIGSGQVVPEALVKARIEAAVNATVGALHEKGWLTFPGEVRDVRVVAMPEEEAVTEIVRDPAGRIVGFQVTTRVVKE